MKPQIILWAMDIGGYQPQITSITYPFMRLWCSRVGAEFRLITERKFPEWDMDYERLQIFELGREADWNIIIDADVLIHPDFFDFTSMVPPDHVCHYHIDKAYNRFVYDDYFRRDGRDIGATNWFMAVPRMCHDAWRPLDDLTHEEAQARTRAVAKELAAGVRSRHLVCDFAISRNIARFGLKHCCLKDLLEQRGDPMAHYFEHSHLRTVEQKIAAFRAYLVRCDLQNWPEAAAAFPSMRTEELELSPVQEPATPNLPFARRSQNRQGVCL